MNRTREQWADVCPKTVAETASPAAVMCLVDDALSDIARLHRQVDKLRAEVEALRAQANALHQVGHALGLPAGSDLTREVQPAIEALRGQLAESRSNDRTAMGYLAEVRAIVGGEDFPAMVRNVEALRKDKVRLDAIEQECWDVRFLSSPNADAGDSSIGIEIVGHFMAEPCERVVGENYNENLRAALDQAMTAEAYPPARPEYDERGRPVHAAMAKEGE